jgi:hypothetical protein
LLRDSVDVARRVDGASSCTVSVASPIEVVGCRLRGLEDRGVFLALSVLRPIVDRLRRPGTGPSRVRDLLFILRSNLAAVIWKAHSVTTAATRVVDPTNSRTE